MYICSLHISYISKDYLKEDLLYSLVAVLAVTDVAICLGLYMCKLHFGPFKSLLHIRGLFNFNCFSFPSLSARKHGLRKPFIKENASIYFQPRTQPGVPAVIL